MTKQYKILKKKKKIDFMDHIFPPIVLGIIASVGLYNSDLVIASQVFIGMLVLVMISFMSEDAKPYTKELDESKYIIKEVKENAKRKDNK